MTLPGWGLFFGIHFVNGADQHPDQGKKQKNDKNIQSNFRNRKWEDSEKRPMDETKSG